LRTWFRETRLHKVDKSVFPSLLNKVWKQVDPKLVTAGFRGSGLFPLDSQKPRKHVTGNSAASSQSSEDNILTSLKTAVHATISPVFISAADNEREVSTRKRRRVQCNKGEILTEQDAINRLKLEEEHRQSRQKKRIQPSSSPASRKITPHIRPILHSPEDVPAKSISVRMKQSIKNLGV
jgi:hypothetical protein